MRASRWALVLVAVLTGCEQKAAPPPAPSASAPASASGSAPAAAPGPVRGVGLEAPGNDPALTAAARKTLIACEPGWKKETGFDRGCEALKAYLAQKIERGAQDATLVDFLEDPSPKVRELGARGLSVWGDAYRTNRALSERVIAAAEKETGEALTGVLGYLVGEIILDKTGLADRVRILAQSASTPLEVRAGVLSIALHANPEDKIAFDLTRGAAEKEVDARLRNAAQSALSAVYEQRPAEVCKLWVQNRGSADETVAANAAARLCAGASWVGYSSAAWSSTSAYPITENRCAGEIEPTLAAIEERARAGKIANENWIMALRGVLREDLKKTPAAQRKRALAAARLIAETKENNPGSRGSALRLVIERDPAGKAFAAKFEKDGDAYVKGIAAEAGQKK